MPTDTTVLDVELGDTNLSRAIFKLDEYCRHSTPEPLVSATIVDSDVVKPYYRGHNLCGRALVYRIPEHWADGEHYGIRAGTEVSHPGEDITTVLFMNYPEYLELVNQRLVSERAPSDNLSRRWSSAASWLPWADSSSTRLPSRSTRRVQLSWP